MLSSVAEFGNMILIGFTAGVWVLPLLLRLSILTPSHISSLGKCLGPWSTLIALGAPLVFYQVGYLVNSLCHLIMIHTLNHKPRDPMYSKAGLDYEDVRAYIQAFAPPQSRQGIATERSMIRQARANTLNFLFSAAVLYSWGGGMVIWGSIALLASIAWLAQTIFAFRRYHSRVIRTYRMFATKGLNARQGAQAREANETTREEQ